MINKIVAILPPFYILYGSFYIINFMPHKHNTENKGQNYVSALSALILSAAAVFIIALIINFFIKDAPDTAFIAQTFSLNLQYFKPESAEKYAFFISTFLFPFIYIYARHFTAKLKFEIPQKYIVLVQSLFIFPITALFFIICNSSLFFPSVLTFTAAFFTAAAVMYILPKIKFTKKAYWTIAVLLCILTAYICYTPVILFDKGHFTAYFAPIYKVYSGLIPAVDFNNLYGFYPYIWQPLLYISGGADLAKISIINTVLVCCSLLFIAGFLYLTVRNKLTAVLGLAFYAILFYIYPISQGHYLQFMPHRVYFIALILLLCAIYLKLQKPWAKKLCSLAGYITAVKAMIWNFESGFIVLAAWAALPVLLKLPFIGKNNKAFIKTVLSNALYAALSLLCAIGIIELITYIKAGRFLGIGAMFGAQSLFYKTGYFMEPMTFGQPWLILLLIYAVALIKSFNLLPFYKGRDDYFSSHKAALYFILAFTGLGIFTYYQGRSVLGNLAAVSFPAALLLILFAQEYEDKTYACKYKNKKVLLSTVKTPLIFLFCFVICAAALKLPAMCRNIADNKAQIYNETLFKEYDFLKANNTDLKTADILAVNSAMLYALANAADKLPFPAFIDLGLKSDYEKIYAYLKTSDNALVLDRKFEARLSKYNAPLLDYIKADYILQESGESLYIYTKKQY